MATSANEVGVSLPLASSTPRAALKATTFIRLLVLGALFAASGVGPAFGQGATKPLPDDVVVHRGVYRYADQQWIPGEPVAQKTLAVLYDNTNGTGGFQPPSQLPGVDVPATFLDWATCDGGIVKKIDIGYATDEPVVRMELSLHTGTTDTIDGPEILSLSLSNLPGSQSGGIEVFMVTVEDFSEEDVFGNAPYLPPGPCGAALMIFEKGTGWLTADGGRGITDFFRLLGEQVNRTIDGFFAQFYLRIEGDPAKVWYVDPTVPPGGDGSRANPFNPLNAVHEAAGEGDVIYLYGGTHVGPLVLKENQQVFGGVFGDIQPGDPPVITNPGGTAVEVKGCGVKMSGFDIMGADIGTLIAGFYSPIPESCFVISEEIKANLIGVAWTFGEASRLVRITITNADMSQVGVGLSIEGGTVDVNLEGNGRIEPREGGTAVKVTGGHSGTLNVGADWTITTRLGPGLEFNDAHGEYTFDGPVTVEEGGISISDSNLTLNVDEINIEDAPGDGILVENSNLTYNGRTVIVESPGTYAIKITNAEVNFDIDEFVKVDDALGAVLVEKNSVFSLDVNVVDIANIDSTGIRVDRSELKLVADSLNISKVGGDGIRGDSATVEINAANVNMSDIGGSGFTIALVLTYFHNTITFKAGQLVGATLSIENSDNVDVTVNNLIVTEAGGAALNVENSSGEINITNITALNTAGPLHVNGFGGGGSGGSGGQLNMSVESVNYNGGTIDIRGGFGGLVPPPFYNFGSIRGVSEGEPQGDFFIRLQGPGDFNIRDLDLDGAGAVRTGLSAEGVNLTIDEVKIKDILGDALKILGGEVTLGHVNIDGAETGINAQDGSILHVQGGMIQNTRDGVWAEAVKGIHIMEIIGAHCDNAFVLQAENIWFHRVSIRDCIRGLMASHLGGGTGSGGAKAQQHRSVMISNSTITTTGLDGIHIETGGTDATDVMITNTTVAANGDNGIVVRTTGSSQALVTLTGNTVSAATNDFLLSQQDNSTLLLAGFEGGDADAVTSFLQATNTGTPSVVVIGSIGAAPASDTADLRLLAKTVSDTRPVAGDTLTYTLRAANAGPAPATEVMLADLLPAGLTYVPGTLTVNGDARTDAPDSDDADFGSTAANTVTVTAATFAVGDTLILGFQVRLDEAADGTTITNTATITGAEPDALSGNNDASVAIDVGVATAVEEAGEMPEAFVLDQNYPNPFNPITTIRYAVPQPSRVRLWVYDVLGRRVAVLVDEQKAAGRYEVRFDARGLPSGMYVYQMTTEGFTQTRKLILLK